MRLNGTCFVPKVTAYGQAGSLTSISHGDVSIDGTQAIGCTGTLHTMTDADIAIDAVQAMGEAQTLSIETEIVIAGVEGCSHTESFRLPTLTSIYPSILHPSANVIRSSVRLFGVGAKGQANKLRCAKSEDMMVAVAA